MLSAIGMLIHLQKSHTRRCEKRTGRREVQNRELVK
jgi:hypothetical protein